MGTVNRRITAQISLGINIRPFPKITETKRDGSVAPVIEHLSSKCKALSSKSSTAKKKKIEPCLFVYIEFFSLGSFSQ
jgi:hypothetical protein